MNAENKNSDPGKEITAETLQNRMMDSESYLLKHHVDFYMGDAVKLMLQCKALKVQIQSSNFLHQYFSSLKAGTHIAFREYSFVHATPWNRKSFLVKFWNAFSSFHKTGNLLSVKDYHALLCTLCHDFPVEMVNKVVDIILLEDALDSVMPFTDFMYAFQFRFYYDEFSAKCYEVFNKNATLGNNEEDGKDFELSSKKLWHILKDLFYNNKSNNSHEAPSEMVVQKLLERFSSVTLYKFLTVLCKSDEIFKEIGVLTIDS